MVTPCAQYQPETLPPAAAKGIDQGQDGASMGREEAHQLVQADCRRAWCLLQGRPSSWCSPFPGSRRTRETRCSPWGGEEHQLVHAAAGELSVCCKAAPSSWCSTFPGSRRTRETRCSPWEGRAPARPPIRYLARNTSGGVR